MSTPATLSLSESNGAGEVVTDNVSNVNFGGVDSPNIVPANHPIVRVDILSSWFSFWKCMRIKLESLGDSLLIDTLKSWKASGDYVTGEDSIFTTDANQAFLTPAKTNLEPGRNIAVLPTSDATASARIGIGGSFAGSWNSAPQYSDYKIFQTRINVTFTTPIGALNQKTYVFQYNES